MVVIKAPLASCEGCTLNLQPTRDGVNISVECTLEKYLSCANFEIKLKSYLPPSSCGVVISFIVSCRWMCRFSTQQTKDSHSPLVPPASKSQESYFCHPVTTSTTFAL